MQIKAAAEYVRGLPGRKKPPPQISPGGESVDGDLPPAAPVAETAPTHRYVSLHRQPVPRRYRLLLLALF